MTSARHVQPARSKRPAGLRNPFKSLLLGMIRGYQIFISPALPRACKYHPSCSQYAVDALTKYGVLRGLVLAGWRILRCNPLSYGGYDPVEAQTLFRARRRGGSE
jgi:putative membrane protein insertion efficiency factor